MTTELYYFTGTGNGLHIAKTIQNRIGEDTVTLTPINTLALDKAVRTTAKRVGIIYPTYAMTAPAIVKRFAKQLQLEDDAYVFLYAHCGGGGTGAAIYSIKRILFENGIQVSNTFDANYPSNSAIMSYDEEKLETVLTKAQMALDKHIESIITTVKVEIPNPTALKNASISAIEKVTGLSENILQFKVITHNDNCIGCKTCSRVCPVENIQMDSNHPKFDTHCEMCLSCVNQCPKKALRYGKMKQEKLMSYKHPEVTLKELMYR